MMKPLWIRKSSTKTRRDYGKAKSVHVTLACCALNQILHVMAITTDNSDTMSECKASKISFIRHQKIDSRTSRLKYLRPGSIGAYQIDRKLQHINFCKDPRHMIEISKNRIKQTTNLPNCSPWRTSRRCSEFQRPHAISHDKTLSRCKLISCRFSYLYQKLTSMCVRP